MSAALSVRELDVVTAITKAGLSSSASTLAVVMAVREHARPAPELADIVRQYQGLENRVTAEETIDELRRIGWLTETESYGVSLIHQAPDLLDKIAGKLGDPSISSRLIEMRSSFDQNVHIIGPMKDRRTYDTYLDRLRGAQAEICLPMLATSPSLSSVPIIQERARSGVRVRILLGSPHLVAQLRGDTMSSVARDAIYGWLNNARGYPTIEVRVSDSGDDMQIASCMLVDNRLLRFDVYDPSKQRSLEGVMIEVDSSGVLELNFISLFRKQFEQSWASAKPTSRLSAGWWYLSKGWQWWCFILFAVLAVVSKKAAWMVLGSAAATFLVNALASSWKQLRGFISFR